jgi:GntR family transcriptional regulator, transcriptional repressor for pyruvate dehydrogenase complex
MAPERQHHVVDAASSDEQPATSSASSSETQFEPLSQPRAHEYVAEQIRRRIKLRLAGPGSALPSERELVKQFGVGRPTIQMALRLLEAEHLIKVRRGRAGGTFIIEPVEDEDARYELISTVRRQATEIKELLMFRIFVEPQIAAAAAADRRAADVKRIKEALRKENAAKHDTTHVRYDTELHLAIGAATRNRFLMSAAEQIREGLNDVISLLPDSALWHPRVSVEHDAMVEAIESRDAEQAADVMRAHATTSRENTLAVLAAIKRGGSV